MWNRAPLGVVLCAALVLGFIGNPGAVAEAKALVKEHPWMSSAYAEGVALYQKGQYEEAIPQFQTAWRTHPYNPNIPYYIGESLSHLGRWNSAKAYYQQAIMVGPNSTAGRLAIDSVGNIDAYNERYGWILPLETSPGPAAPEPLSVEEGEGQNVSETRIVPVSYLATAEDAPDYLDVVAGTNSGVVFYWPQASMPLKIYIESRYNGFEAQSMVRTAMNPWISASDGQIQYLFTADSSQADIIVKWPDRLKTFVQDGTNFEENGKTHVETKADGQLRLVVEITHFSVRGEAHSHDSMVQTLTHEMGHALGLLGHSDNPKDVMYFCSTQANKGAHLTRRDIQTMKRLYQGTTMASPLKQ